MQHHMRVRFTSYLRLVLVVLASYALMVLIPNVAMPFLGWQVLSAAIVIVCAIILSVLLLYSLNRRHQLFESVRVELNKIRRIYHLSKNLAATSTEFRAWFTELHGYVYGYLNLFGEKNWETDRDEFNAAFRKVSYHIYTVPELKTKKEEMLYEDLLRSTGMVAEARQKNIELFDSGFTSYAWLAILFMVAGSIMAVVMSADNSIAFRFIGGTAVASILVILDVVSKVDSLSNERYFLAHRYVENIARLELKR